MTLIPRSDGGSAHSGDEQTVADRNHSPAAPEATQTTDFAVPAPQEQPEAAPEPTARQGFRERGQLRRRLRYLRRVRELALRDLGGLVFDMRRFARPREDLVALKVETLTAIDSELRALEHTLEQRQPLAVLREPGIAACPRCAALHGSDANFCPNCGLPLTGKASLPIAPPSGGT
jgi:hypothetical protein